MSEKIKLTDAEKLVIITKTLELIKNGHRTFICPTIEQFVDSKYAFDAIPELLEYKPFGKSDKNAWWLDDEVGLRNRINVLTKLQIRFNHE